MRFVIPALAAALMVCIIGLSPCVADGDDVAARKGKAASAQSCFEELKKLEGEWVGKLKHGDEEAEETMVRYSLTGAGSALVEHLFEGTNHEMITVYHLDGDRLILTHYCAAKNQPRMYAKLGDDPRTIAFKFLDGTNMDPAKDMHMHEATIRLVDEDRLQSEWTSFMNGKPMGKASFDLTRKKGDGEPE